MKTIKLFFLSLGILISGALFAQDYKANTNKTEIKWTGKKVTGEHFGFIKLKEGTLTLKNGNIASGSFTIDMNTITCTDLEDAETNAKLVGHLKSDDFFGVKTYPTAKLEIVKASPFEDYKSEVEAKVTIKGKTETIKV
jgi:polyisoprenoid-binding protein YceI